MPEYLRGFCERATLANGKTGEAIRFVASTAGVKRDGLAIDQNGWQLDTFKANPAFLWVHDYMGNRPPIGRVEKVWVEGGSLKADVLFDQGDEFAREVERKYRQGFLNAVSVGFDVLEVAPSKEAGQRGTATKTELLDLSAVPIPGDPGSLMERQKRNLQALATDILREIDLDDDDKRAAIPPHSGPKADENASWDAGSQVGQCPAEAAPLRRMHAWVNSDADADAKQSYKLPHHTAEGAVVLRGVMAAMARLMQSGTQIPDADRRGVYNHLAAHYRQFDKEPPEFRSNAELDGLGPAELRGLFLHGEPDLVPEVFDELEQRGHAVLSARNEDDLNQAIRLIRGVISRAGQDEPAADDGEERSLRLLQSALRATGD